MKRTIRRTIDHVARLATVPVLALALLPGEPVSAARAGGATTDSELATFEGTTFRMADGWGEAHACYVSIEGNRCYRTGAEMDAAEGLDGGDSGASSPTSGGTYLGGRRTVLTLCSTGVRLYDGTSWTGDQVYLGDRFIVIDLSTLGFNNRTSSYTIGACSATFYDSTSGSGSTYPGSTSAGSSAGSMLSGWNNVVGSVAIS